MRFRAWIEGYLVIDKYHDVSSGSLSDPTGILPSSTLWLQKNPHDGDGHNSQLEATNQ